MNVMCQHVDRYSNTNCLIHFAGCIKQVLSRTTQHNTNSSSLCHYAEEYSPLSLECTHLEFSTALGEGEAAITSADRKRLEPDSLEIELSDCSRKEESPAIDSRLIIWESVLL
jgi:hypothetical protein